MECALCGNTDAFETVAHVDSKSSEPLQVSLCGHYGLIQQLPIPSIHDLNVYYSHHYRRDYKNAYIPKAKHVYRAGKTAMQRINFLKSANIEHGSLLDIGAGGGEFVYLSGKSGFVSQGIEKNIGYSEYARNAYRYHVMTVDTSANLKLLLEAKTIPESLVLPSATSVFNLKKRLRHKGWFEYLFAGHGYMKPIGKLKQYIDEARLAKADPKAILDNFY